MSPTTPGGCDATTSSSPGTVSHSLQYATESARPSYTVPAGGGVITSWTHRATGSGSLRLKVYRRTAVNNTFVVVDSSSVQTPTAAQNYTYATRIPVQAGDILGVTVTANGAGCMFNSPGGPNDLVWGDPYASETADGTTTTFDHPSWTGPVGNLRVNVSAKVEADADGDGHGDETQDSCTASPTQDPCPPFSSTEGVAFSGVVGTFGTYSDPAGDCTFTTATTINWGDGDDSPGTWTNTVHDPENFYCEYTLSGTHTYIDHGVNVAWAGWSEASTPRTGIMYARTDVADAPITATGTSILAPPGSPFTGAVASFTSPDSNDSPGTYTASIDWGDGTSSTAGTITSNGSGGFDVSGSHTYAAGGSSTVTITVTGDAGATALATTTRRGSASGGSGSGGGTGDTGGTGGTTDSSSGPPTGFGLSFTGQKLARALSRGFTASGGCAQACLVNAQLVLGGKLAKKLRLSKKAKPVVVAKGSALAPAGGKAQLKLKFTTKAKRAFKKLHSIKLSLVGTPSNAGGVGAKKTRSVTLRR